MLKEHRFLVSYIINNQPRSTELCLENETLTPEEARVHLENARAIDADEVITDIQVMGIHHPRKPGHHPGHYQQPVEGYYDRPDEKI